MTVAPGSTDAPTVEPGPPAAPRSSSPSSRRDLLLRVLAVAAIIAGVVARAWPRSALWLDEAQSVAFARLPLLDIPHALRTDGAPPLYYLLLHGWMALFGEADAAVRSLSVLLSVATIGLLWSAMRRLAGPRAAWAAAVLLSINPFAVRYAAEGRMYALVAFEVTLGMLALPAALRRPSPLRLAAIALLSAALLYTHYWAIYLLAAVGLVVAFEAWRQRSQGRAGSWWRVAAAMAGGGVLWLPWVPTFRFQAERTATPWTVPPKAWEVFDIPLVQAGGHNRPAYAIVTLFGIAVLSAVVPAGPRPRWLRRALDRVPLLGRCSAVSALAFIGGVGAVIAVAGAMRSGSALAGRYTSVFLPVLMALVALGLTRVRPVAWTVAVLSVLTALSALLVTREIGAERTPGRHIATVLAATAQPGDVVVFCPDQLGPATVRELQRRDGPELQLGTYPDWSDPARVDWIDYTDRYESSVPSAFAIEAARRAGDHRVWLVWSDGYPPTQRTCRALRRSLRSLRPAEVQYVADQPGRHLDHGALYAFDA